MRRDRETQNTRCRPLYRCMARSRNKRLRVPARLRVFQNRQSPRAVQTRLTRIAGCALVDLKRRVAAERRGRDVRFASCSGHPPRNHRGCFLAAMPRPALDCAVVLCGTGHGAGRGNPKQNNRCRPAHDPRRTRSDGIGRSRRSLWLRVQEPPPRMPKERRKETVFQPAFSRRAGVTSIGRTRLIFVLAFQTGV